MSQLTSNQIQLLRELEHHGGALIVRTKDDELDYLHLHNAGLINCFTSSLPVGEVRYEITEAGRAALIKVQE
jgi:hypothetical protein